MVLLYRKPKLYEPPVLRRQTALTARGLPSAMTRAPAAGVPLPLQRGRSVFTRVIDYRHLSVDGCTCGFLLSPPAWYPTRLANICPTDHIRR
jgi:hypothetical protein